MLEFNKLERKIAERLGNFAVTPCVGVWIEIHDGNAWVYGDAVTPCVGVWIEILGEIENIMNLSVTPCVGVWIEILPLLSGCGHLLCHSLCGSVD